MTTTIIVNGTTYIVPNEKLHQILNLLESVKVSTSQQQVREVLTSQPLNDGRSLING
jgi:hypothetical protein